MLIIQVNCVQCTRSRVNVSLDCSGRSFVVANAQADGTIIYCNERFCQLVGYSRAEVMQKSCITDFLHGPLTSAEAVAQVKDSLRGSVERKVRILYYKKGGKSLPTNFPHSACHNSLSQSPVFIYLFFVKCFTGHYSNILYRSKRIFSTIMPS